MNQQSITSIDIGSSMIRCVIAERGEGDIIRILGVGNIPSEGLRRGAVVDVASVSQSITRAVDAAELMSGIQVKSAIVSIGGSGISIQETKGVVAVGRANSEVSEDDISRVLAAAQSIAIPTNKEIIHVMPRMYRLDDQENIADPIGLKGVRLEVSAHIVEAPMTHVKNINAAMERANVEVEEFVVEPLAASEAVISKKQKELGVALVTLGASTTSIAIFEEGELLHAAIIPVGADYITQDLAIGMRTSMEVAEKVKISYGSAKYNTIKRTDEIDLSNFDSHEEGAVLHDHVIEIIVARLEEIFTLIREEFASVGKDQLLPAGVVFVGGGSNLVHIVDYAKEVLQLPVHVGKVNGLMGIMDHVDDPSFATSIGLIMWRINYEDKYQGENKFGSMIGGVGDKMSGVFSGLKSAFDRFLP